MNSAEFRKTMGSYPTGVCVIATVDAGRLSGMVVGSFTSVSLDPPLVGFFPDKASTSWPLIESAGMFCANVIAHDQEQVCRAAMVKGEAKFASVEYSLSERNLPIIANSVLAIECEIRSVTAAGDHWFVLADVLHLQPLRDTDPILFHRGRYRSVTG